MARGAQKNKNSNGKFQHNNRKKKFISKSNRKTHFKSNNKRKLNENDKHNPEYNEEKRQKIDISYQNRRISSSESEDEETENPLTQLLNTFDVSVANKKVSAIETDDSETSISENEESHKVSEADNVEESDNSEIEDTILNESDNETKMELKINDNFDDKLTFEEEEELLEENEIYEETLKVNSDLPLSVRDPFVQHLCYDLSDNLVDSLQNTHKKEIHNLEWPWLGKLLISIPSCEELPAEKSNFTIAENKMFASLGKVPPRIDQKNINFEELNIKSQIHAHIKPANKELDADDSSPLTEFQSELFSIMNNYQDLYYTERTFENSEEIRFVYCLHAINHVLKTRTKILHHNAHLQKKDDVPEEYRDQGLVRPKVLIVVPFRDSAMKIVQMLIGLLVPNEAGQVINKKRFVEDFSGGELIMPKKNPKPEDYELTFTGNCDDTFKIGIQVTKKSLKLYADFYSSDIIIASPLGLRLTVGAEGEAERDHDFLASIELLILDQTELFLMQNWDHVTHVLDHLHVQPKEAHGTDFGRVRTWALNGWTRYYRQSLVFSAFSLPEINAVFNRRCANYAGAVRTVNSVRSGSIVNVHVQVPQVYKRFAAEGVTKTIDARFDFFVNKVLPQYKDTIMKQCLIYVPSYFDYVRIRNYFKREDIGFVQICEYSKDAKIARARDMFFHGDSHFLLYSERFHYFRRIRVKGIRHIIFYQPPTFPHFYSEMCNFLQEANQNKKCGSASNMTVTVIYSKYDSHQMAAILGTERLTKMAASTNNFHMFTSSDS